jgi:glucosamine-6-phosphate deaminase
VPSHAITVTIPALLRARRVIAVVPEARKAEPVRAALCGPISTACPASALRTAAHAAVHLDPDSARLLP